MKSGFKLLIFLFVLIGGYLYIPRYIAGDAPRCVDGKLSDIAEEVTSIPLTFPAGYNPGRIHSVQKDDDHLFVLCDHVLFHFNKNGDYLGKISIHKAGTETISVTHFTLNTGNKELVAIGNNQIAYVYDYNGVLIQAKDLKDLKQNGSKTKLLSLAYYNNQYWATTEQVIPDKTETRIEKKLCGFTQQLQPLTEKTLCQADLGRFYMAGYFDPQVAVWGGGMYVYSPSLCTDSLVQDTLYLIGTNQLEAERFQTEQTATVLPLQLSDRFLISSYSNTLHADTCYTYCFDRRNNIAYFAKGGLVDDYYQTGRIAEFHPLDIQCKNYYFCRKQTAPAGTAYSSNSTVTLYLVKLEA
ncbi:hypothetical protein A9168_03130 [Macellibacteroides sp. HH-ZS]|nr:hypothetical protein A9168_03130 [Macellibacteroides sp. HH-ZS]